MAKVQQKSLKPVQKTIAGTLSNIIAAWVVLLLARRGIEMDAATISSGVETVLSPLVAPFVATLYGLLIGAIEWATPPSPKDEIEPKR